MLGELRRSSVVVVAPAPIIKGYEQVVELRRGGQGIVYSATQASTRRKVAIKVLLEVGANPALARRRFEREVDLIARMRHPRIVSVYDSGLTDDARPYLVMEFVEGQPLDQFTKSQGWGGPDGARPIVELIARVCEAVEYAHQRGVIHRDLKPSNIRVRPDGEPCVLDFGLAKLGENAGASEERTLSIDGQFLGSLAWASPEQTAGDIHALDVRSDVYSLGVVLYQALTGQFPYDVKGGLRRTLDQIATVEPKAPKSIAPWMDDDLQQVLLKCLEKDPANRYQSASELSRDLRRYLAGEPVSAGESSGWTTLRHAVRRHRRVAVITASALVAVAGIAVWLGVLYTRASRAEAGLAIKLQEVEQARAEAESAKSNLAEQLRQVQAARSEAERQAGEKRATSEFLESMFASPDPSVRGKDVKVVDMLDLAVHRLEQDQNLAPATRVALEQTLGGTYRGLGLLEQAEPLTERALAARIKDQGESSFDTIQAMVNLGLLRIDQGRLDQAEQVMARATELAEKNLPLRDQARSGARHGLGMVLHERGQWAKAEATQRQALDETRKNFQDTDRLAEVCNSLAITLRKVNKFDEAAELFREAITNAEKSKGPNSAMVMTLKNNLGNLLHQRGQHEKAETLYKETIEGRTKLYGPDHPETLTAMSNYAKLLSDMDRTSESLPMQRDIYAKSLARLGPEHPTTLTFMNNLANNLQSTKNLEEAEEMSRACAELRKKVLGPDHPHTLITLSNLATLLNTRGKVDESLKLQNELVDIRTRKLGPDAQETLISCNNYGLSLQKAGKLDEAKAMMERAVSGAEKSFKPEHWITGAFRGNLGRLYLQLNRDADGERELLEAHRVVLAALGPKHAQTKQNAKSLRDYYTKAGKPEEAAKFEPAPAPSN